MSRVVVVAIVGGSAAQSCHRDLCRTQTNAAQSRSRGALHRLRNVANTPLVLWPMNCGVTFDAAGQPRTGWYNHRQNIGRPPRQPSQIRNVLPTDVVFKDIVASSSPHRSLEDLVAHSVALTTLLFTQYLSTEKLRRLASSTLVTS